MPTTDPPASANTENAVEAMIGALLELDVGTREILSRAAHARDVDAGEWIIHAGDTTKELYFIHAGEVEIVQPDADDIGRQMLIATLHGGEFLGEVALIDGRPRTMSARASRPVRLVEVAPEVIEAEPGGPAALTALKAFLGQTVVRRIRNLNTQHVESLERELEATLLQRQFGQFFVYVVAILCMGMIVSNVVATGVLSIDAQGHAFLFAYSVLLGVPSVAVLWYLKLPARDLGISMDGFWRSLGEGLVISAISVVAIVIGAQMAEANGFPLDPVPFNLLGSVFYLLHCFAQEVLGRGVIQNSLRRFLGDRVGLMSVGLSSLLFGTMHVHLGLTAVILTFTASVFFGLVFLRHNNLTGVTVIHFFAGAAAFLTGLI